MPIITVQMLPGRSPAQKRELIRGLAEAAVQALDVPEQSIRILLTEIPPEHWGVGTSAKQNSSRGET